MEWRRSGRIFFGALALTLVFSTTGAARESKAARKAREEQARQEQANQDEAARQAAESYREAEARRQADNDATTVFFVVLGGIVVVGSLIAFMVRIYENGKQQREEHRAKYEQKLDALAKSPGTPGLRQECLDAGRAYYGLTTPDWYTVNGKGHLTGYSDNTAARELRIQSDIEARLSHLKYGGTPSASTVPAANPALSLQSDTDAPARYVQYQCAACGFGFLRTPGDDVCPQCGRQSPPKE